MIPTELYHYKQWVCWSRVVRGGRYIKLPVCPGTGKPASCNDPATWGSYRQARAMMSRHGCAGVGFVFTTDDPYIGVDLDHCRQEDGELAPWATSILGDLNSFSELSPSGKGLHILVKASLVPTSRRRVGSIEMYDSGRYFTITGTHIEGTPVTIEERQDQINRLQASLTSPARQPQKRSEPCASILESDETLLSRARRARNGSKFSKLWAGDLSDYDGDHSRADAALCSMLAFYTKGDAVRIDRLFRASALYRNKWDRRTGSTTYGRMTIEATIQNVFVAVEFTDPRKEAPTTETL